MAFSEPTSTPGATHRAPVEPEPEEVESKKSLNVNVTICKASKRIVYGVVLQPEITDAQGDIISAEVIEKAAHDYLSRFGKKTKVGLQHNSFKKNEDRFFLVESYIAPIGFMLGNQEIIQGSWVMAMKIADDDLWEAVEDGDITGFSIGGKGRAVKLETQDDDD